MLSVNSILMPISELTMSWRSMFLAEALLSSVTDSFLILSSLVSTNTSMREAFEDLF